MYPRHTAFRWLVVGKDCAQKWPNCAHLDKSMKLGWLIV